MPEPDSPFDWQTLPPLRDVIARYELRAEKKLGQNFLLDMNITDKIARVAGDLSTSCIFEIGSGPGGLTRSLLKAGANNVIAIEFDHRAITALQELETASNGRLHVIHGDALETDLLALQPQQQENIIIANLPYNIATPLLIGWLRQIRDSKDAFRMMVLMFQREVAGRLTARPNTKAYGRLSVIAQWLCDIHYEFSLPPQAFVPPPKVTSGVVRFLPKDLPSDSPAFATVEKITAAAFGQRRKMVRTSLKDYADFFESCNINPVWRAGEIPIQTYIDLAKAVS